MLQLIGKYFDTIANMAEDEVGPQSCNHKFRQGRPQSVLSSQQPFAFRTAHMAPQLSKNQLESGNLHEPHMVPDRYIQMQTNCHVAISF